MGIAVPTGTHTHVAGDSITAGGWDVVAGGLKDQMAYARKIASAGAGAQTGTPGANRAILQSGARPGIVVSSAPLLTHTSFGIPGSTIASMTAAYASFITAFLPLNILVLEEGVNDFATDPATFAAAYAAFLDRVHGDAPNAKILCLGIFMAGGEQWLTGPNRFSAGLALTHPIEAAIAASCAARPSFTEYASQCDWTLAYEVANNTPSPGLFTGVLCVDDKHPNPLGQGLMGTHAMSHFTF